MTEQELPEGCIAHILSYAATPADVATLSLVSKAFASAAEYDTVWDRFIPSDLSSFIPSSSTSKKALYLALSDNPTIIDQGKKSFQLEKQSGNKCYMISARDLHVIWGGTSQYWEWIKLPESRFEEVARLYAVCWLEISGKINTRVLSPNTLYAAFLVFKMIDANGFHHHPVMLSVGILGGIESCKNVCLDSSLEDDELNDSFRGLQRPNVRNDRWLEIEMENSEFRPGRRRTAYESQGTTSDLWKHGFFFEGIEVRPKHVFFAPPKRKGGFF
uniref:F-box protein PP2-B10-like protein n=1 Tax=Phaseolus vulgaris TaxID=3885 RepID=T2DNH1_PHAVU|nr:F-box protein PP2-B10-like protein [Phaseolus vulgaris]